MERGNWGLPAPLGLGVAGAAEALDSWQEPGVDNVRAKTYAY